MSREQGGGIVRLIQHQGSNTYPACSKDGRLLAFFSTRRKQPGVYLMSHDLKKARACLERVISPETPMDTGGKRYCWIRRAELALARLRPVVQRSGT